MAESQITMTKYLKQLSKFQLKYQTGILEWHSLYFVYLGEECWYIIKLNLKNVPSKLDLKP